MRWVYLGMGALLLGLSACEQTDRKLEAEDEQNPYFNKAVQAIEARDYLAATRSYEDALQANPNVARAHYELGLIYSEKLGDQISALYHFRKFLAMRPDSPIRDTVQARIDSAKISFAASLPNSPVQNAAVFLKMQTDNDQLHQSLEDAQKKIDDLQKMLASQKADAEPGSVAAATAPSPGAPPLATAVTDVNPTPAGSAAPALSLANPMGVKTAPSTPVATTAKAPTATSGPSKHAAKSAGNVSYTIQSGDSLWKIASKYYPGEAKQGVDTIKAANPALNDPRKLKPGTVITLP